MFIQFIKLILIIRPPYQHILFRWLDATPPNRLLSKATFSFRFILLYTLSAERDD